jgi:hypothetical protein
MPTGYTAELMEKGQDFRTFALTCARAFGATIMQRDDPLSELPKKQDPRNYSAERLAEAGAELTRLRAMNSDERFDFSSKRKNETVTSCAKYLQRARDENKRLDDMLAQVVAWTPPTSEHAGVKAFMIEQITISKNDLKYPELSLREATDKALNSYYEDAVAKAERDIGYYTEEAAKEQQRMNGRNEWIEQLYASLPEAATDDSAAEK